MADEEARAQASLTSSLCYQRVLGQTETDKNRIYDVYQYKKLQHVHLSQVKTTDLFHVIYVQHKILNSLTEPQTLVEIQHSVGGI